MEQWFVQEVGSFLGSRFFYEVTPKAHQQGPLVLFQFRFKNDFIVPLRNKLMLLAFFIFSEL